MGKTKKGDDDHGDIAELEDALIEVDVGYVDPEDAEGKCFAFKSLSEITWLYIILTTNLRTQGQMFIAKYDWNGKFCCGFYQTLLLLLFFLLPVNMMQHVIGNISERSCVVIRHIAPVADGLQYTMVVLTLFELLRVVNFCRDCITYMLCSFSSQWLTCKPSEGCLDKRGILRRATHGFNESEHKQLSTEQFYKESLLHMNEILDPTLYLILQVTLFLFVFLIIYFLGQIDVRRNARIVKICARGYTIGLALMFLAMYINESEIPSHKWASLFLPEDNHFDSFLHPTAWGSSIKYIVIAFVIGLPYNVLVGASLGKYANIEYVTVHVWSISLIFHLFTTLGVIMIESILSLKIGFYPNSLRDKDNSAWFTIIPMQIGLANTGATVLTAGYFAFLSLTAVLLIMIHSSVIISTSSDIKPKLNNYRKYQALGLALFVPVQAFIFEFSGLSHYFMITILEDVHVMGQLIVVFMQSLAALWIHGTHNLADDFHFKFGFQPAFFWKFFWWILPIISMLLILCFAASSLKNDIYTFDFYVKIPIFGFLFLPHLIVLSVQIFKSVENHDLRSLLRKTEEWGSPDERERIDRELYPPREQCKYNRRFDVCRHRCIRYSNILPQIVAKEKEMRLQALKYKRATILPVNPRPTLSDASSDSEG